MGSYIKVDHSELDKAAAKIEEYIERHNQYLAEAGAQVNHMNAEWSGEDYIQYKIQWDRLNDSDATSTVITKVMKAYSDYLRYASSQYKEAQSQAINRANRLPSWK